MITTDDQKLVLKHIIEPRIKLEIYDSNDKYIDTITGGIVSGSLSIDTESDIRRTIDVTFNPCKMYDAEIAENKLIWINRFIKLFIGFYDRQHDTHTWYPQGKYLLTNASVTYDNTTNQVTLNCSDLAAMLDGTINGQIGALLTKFPAYEADATTGEPIKWNIIRNAVITLLSQLGGITDYNIDDIGEYNAMPQYNDYYESYRTAHPQWNAIPYDLEFSAGDTVWSMLTTMRDLYPNYELFADENGTMVMQMIPSSYEDDIVIDNSFLQKILVSENLDIDFTTIHNVCEVWGQTIDADYFANSGVTYSSNTYSATISGYTEKYYTGDLIALRIPSTNSASPKINVNSLGALSVLDEGTDKPLAASALDANTVYVFKLRNKYENHTNTMYAYLLGRWQAHGLDVLTNGKTGSTVTVNGKSVKKYSKAYFEAKYECENVNLTIVKSSPFTVQKIGERLDVKVDGEYENIESDSLAVQRAIYENWKNARLTDSITLTVKYCPWLPVNKKVSYKPHNSEYVNEYIIKQVTHDFTGGTSQITMMTFYPLYTLEDLTHSEMTKYTHSRLSHYKHGDISSK